MSSELTDLLDRQAAFAKRQTDPAEFLLAVVRFTAFIHSDPRLDVHVQDIAREGGVFAEARRAHEAKMVPELIELRGQFVLLAPDLDDSELAEPALGESELGWELSLAYFDRLAASERGSTSGLPVGGGGLIDGSVPRQLIDLLTEKVRNARRPTTPQGPKARPELIPIAERLLELSRGQAYEHRQLLLARRASAATALASLDGIVREVNPRPLPAASMDTFLERALDRGLAGWPVALSKALFNPTALSDDERARLDRVVGQMHTFLDVLYEELRRRLGAVASRLAILQRFKLRCEWHDRHRLERLARDSAEPELALTNELARFLFDQGLNPVTRMRAGGLEPDVFDPLPASLLYVEAKRYSSSNGARRHIRNGLPQIHDTAGRLRGSAYEIGEVFYVVFRQGGPRYMLPHSLRGEDYVVYPLLIDIAPLEQSGSRSRTRAVRIDANELEPLLSAED